MCTLYCNDERSTTISTLPFKLDDQVRYSGGVVDADYVDIQKYQTYIKREQTNKEDVKKGVL